MAVIAPEMTNAESLTRMALTPSPRAVLVVPDRPQLQAEPGPSDEPRDRDRPGGVTERDVVEGRVVGRRRPGQERRAQPARPAGEGEVERHELEDEEDGDGDHDERVPPHSQRD